MKSARSLIFAALIGGAAFLAGCADVTEIIRADYVAADRATYDAVAPAYSAYVSSDDSLTADEKARRYRTIDTWLLRLEQAEAPVTSASSAEVSS